MKTIAYIKCQSCEVSLPLSFRFSMGKNVKYFIESGVGFNLIVAPNVPGFNYYPLFGMGIRIPMKGIEWIVKTDYKIEVNTTKDHTSPYNKYYRLAVGIRKNKYKMKE